MCDFIEKPSIKKPRKYGAFIITYLRTINIIIHLYELPQKYFHIMSNELKSSDTLCITSLTLYYSIFYHEAHEDHEGVYLFFKIFMRFMVESSLFSRMKPYDIKVIILIEEELIPKCTDFQC